MSELPEIPDLQKSLPLDLESPQAGQSTPQAE